MIRESLMGLRREILERLRKIEPALVAELEQIDKALEAIDPQAVGVGEFSSLTIIDAVRVYLARSRRCIAEADLIRALVAGGAGQRTGSRAPEWKIAQSISHHVSRGNLTLVNGMVGLPEWDEGIAIPKLLN